MGKKFVMSYSCGKDSNLALYRMIKNGDTPLAFLVTVNEEDSRSFFHGIPEYLLLEISKSLNIEVEIIKCKGEEYKSFFEQALKKWKDKGADYCAFGDIDIEEHRHWCSERCEAVNMKPLFPLWQENREALTIEFIESGFKGVIKNVRLKELNEEFLGKILDKEVIADIKETGADICGENGEYHTFVYNGPTFTKEIEFSMKGNILTSTHGYLNIE